MYVVIVRGERFAARRDRWKLFARAGRSPTLVGFTTVAIGCSSTPAWRQAVKPSYLHLQRCALPLGLPDAENPLVSGVNNGEWRSSVAFLLWGQAVGGSNPPSPT